MSQQINLLNPALIKQKDLLNTNNMTITLGLLSALMLGYYGYAQKQLSLLTMQRSQIAEELTMVQAQLKQTALLHAPHELNKALLDQIKQLEQKAAMQQQVLQTVNLSSATPDKGYAALMRAFARQSIDGLWLTSFSIDSNSERLNISGRTLQADLVPEYISRLGNEPALKGKSFSALNMSLPEADPATANNLAVQTATAQNSKPATPANPTALVTKSQTREVQYIEFSLQSTNEKMSANTESTSKLSADRGKS